LGVVDASFASDSVTRKSVTGYLIYFCGCLVAWKSKAQKGVTLSSTESEYVGISEISCEILFIRDILTFLGIEIELPITIKVDNAGAIFLANNRALGQRTKHVDTRYHFVRNYVEDGILKIVYVKGVDNDADIMTKNTDKNTFWRHASKFMDYGKLNGKLNVHSGKREDVNKWDI